MVQPGFINPFPIFDAPVAGRCVVYSPMMLKVIWHARHSIARKIVGCCDIDQRKVAERTSNQPGVGERAHAQHAVDIVFDQIDCTVAYPELDIDIPVTIKKIRKSRRNDETAYSTGNIDTDLA